MGDGRWEMGVWMGVVVFLGGHGIWDGDGVVVGWNRGWVVD